ncbi:MAG TPA: TolC family protein [Spirochaetota bacterium]|nr:TolC family protein [Spirochaetota bacterium]
MKRLLYFIIFLAACPCMLQAEDAGNVLSMTEFVSKSAQNDPHFQVILADELYLAYEKDLELPASDIILDVTAQYNLNLEEQTDSDENEYEGSISLSRLFPKTGTTLTAGYSAQQYTVRDELLMRTTFNAQVSQDIARNAFGRATRLKEKEIDVSSRLARYQVIEAYEDYMASLITLYMDWYASYENLKAVEEIVQYNTTLLQTIQRKQRYRVARPEDVDKMRLELASAREDMITMKDRYQRNAVKVYSSAGLAKEKKYIPQKPAELSYDDDIENTGQLLSGRTMLMMKLLKRQGIIAADIAKDNLLPSAQLFAGYRRYGTDYDMNNPRDRVYGGISSAVNFGRQQEKAAFKTAGIDLYRQKMSNKSTLLSLETDLADLKRKIQRERELIKITDQKMILVERVLKAEQNNYMIGKTSLNDLIMHKNNAAQIRYNAIYHRVLYRQLVVEWKRLTDVLVDKDVLQR